MVDASWVFAVRPFNPSVVQPAEKPLELHMNLSPGTWPGHMAPPTTGDTVETVLNDFINNMISK